MNRKTPVLADLESPQVITPERSDEFLNSQVPNLNQGLWRLTPHISVYPLSLDEAPIQTLWERQVTSSNLRHNENYKLPNGIGLRGVITKRNLNLSALNMKLSRKRRDLVEEGFPYTVLSLLKDGAYRGNQKSLIDLNRKNLNPFIPCGRYSFVISQAGEILIEFEERSKAFQNEVIGSHVIISLGYPVQFAGEVEFDRTGHVVNWNNKSGTYQFPDEYLDETVRINYLEQALFLGLPQECYNHYDEPERRCPTLLEQS